MMSPTGHAGPQINSMQGLASVVVSRFYATARTSRASLAWCADFDVSSDKGYANDVGVFVLRDSCTIRW